MLVCMEKIRIEEQFQDGMHELALAICQNRSSRALSEDLKVRLL